MNTMYRKRTQLSVVAVAALAIIAVAAVMLLAGGKPAQADTVALAPDSGGSNLPPQQAATPTPTPPRHAPPPACPGETGNPNKTAAAVVDSGHIALFDVWWNPEEKELTNTSCPPTVTHVKEVKKKGKVVSPARDVRTPSNIDIDKTVIHIPNSAKVNLKDADTPYPKGHYPDLWKADALENRDAVDGKGDGMVWALPACPTGSNLADGKLCLSFSAALLNPLDWAKLNDDDGVKIEYLLDHVHQVDIDKQDPRYTLAYDIPKGGATSELEPLWDSSDLQVAKMQVAPGEYRRPTLFFTSRGTYEFQVHIRGNPSDATNRSDNLKPVSEDDSVTSDMRTYIVHVGAEADLSVTTWTDPVELSIGEDAYIKITASNNGPDPVPNTKVDVALPQELTYSSTRPNNVSFTDRDSDGVWTWDTGNMASGTTKVMTAIAKVDKKESRGRKLVVKATISGTEPVKITETDTAGDKTVRTYPLPAVDPDPDNNVSEVIVTVAGGANVDPIFMVMRSVPEMSPADTLVGDPIMVREPNTKDTLTFNLTGEGADQFAVSSASGSAQIKVADGADLDFEGTPTYNLVLGVSDGRNAANNADPSIDHTIGVLVKLKDVAGDPSVTVTASATSVTKGEHVTLTATPNNLPEGYSDLTYQWIERFQSGDISTPHGRTSSTMTLTRLGGSGPDPVYFSVEISWKKDGKKTTIRSSEVLVTWR